MYRDSIWYIQFLLILKPKSDYSSWGQQDPRRTEKWTHRCLSQPAPFRRLAALCSVTTSRHRFWPLERLLWFRILLRRRHSFSAGSGGGSMGNISQEKKTSDLISHRYNRWWRADLFWGFLTRTGLSRLQRDHPKFSKWQETEDQPHPCLCPSMGMPRLRCPDAQVQEMVL